MSEPEQDVTVEEAGVSVKKSLNDHQFETLAVVFDVRSAADGPATVTITDLVPDSVPDDDIGFHPEYGGEHWRAEEGQVVFSREFGPGEQYTTVYGVRDFDGARTDLLAEPEVGVGEPGEVTGLDDLVSPEDSEVVREVISGDRDTLPGLEADDEGADGPADVEVPEAVETEEPAAAEDEEPLDEAEPALDEPLPGMGGGDEETVTAEASPLDDESDETAEDELFADATTELDPDDADVEEALEEEPDDDEETEPMPPEDADSDDTIEDEPPAAEPDEGAAEEPSGVESVMADVGESATTEEPADDEVTVPVTGGIARVLAKELRAGNVSPEDRRLLKEELLPEDGSTDARIQRLQTQVADLEAYTAALEAFLDEEGGAQAVLADVESRVEDLAEDVAAVEETVATVDDEVYALADDVEDVEDEVEEVSRDVDEVSTEVDSVAGDVDQLEGEVAEVRDDVGRIDAVDRKVERVEDDVSAIHDELEELAEFRDRLSSAFGGGMGGGEDDDF